ncbi:MAG: S8 family serine peptidase [Arenimonas sp.]|jgi:serine protease AprX
MHRSLKSVTFKLSAIASGILFSGIALAEAQISADLAKQLSSALPGEELTVVVTYDHSGPINATQLGTLKSLGITKGITMRSLPIAGVVATPSEIRALASQPDVLSIFPNRPLRYFNKEARQISGAERVVANQGDFGRAVPYSGKGVSVVVNDSGIDATHMDLEFGKHVVENVQGATNLAAVDTMLPITYVQGMPNTDTGSGHGTHCAGTIGGTGARSNGLYRGVAPGADLVGYGSGAVLLILDAVGGLDYAITNQFSFRSPIRVVSNSWGSSGAFEPMNPVNVSTYEAYKRGIVSVFAAGNDGPGEDTHNPYAQAPWVISVGAGEKNGRLTDFSSRGKRFETGTFTMPDGKSWTYFNEPTIVATGVDIVSTRDSTGVLPPLEAEHDANTLDPAHLPFYTHMSGTSMATPHTAGIIALMFEANPNLTPAKVKSILEETATNMTGRENWEVGSGHVNAYAAVAMAQGIRTDYGKTVNALRTFNSNAQLAAGTSMPFSVFFSPVGTPEEKSFEVGPGVAWVSARATVDANTVAVVLTAPDGQRYGSAIALPVLGDTVVVSAPAQPGTWTVTVRGIGSVSGTALDPAGVTNGYAAPGYVDGTISFLNSAGYLGLDDIANHPARGAIEYAVSNRLVDGYSDKKFRPDALLKRSEMAQYLVMGVSSRQALPFSNTPSFSDLATTNAAYPYAESAVAVAAPLRDLSQTHAGLMGLVNGKFLPTNSVNRLQLAYALVQALGLQNEAVAYTGTLSVSYDGKRIPIEDAASIPANLRGYVQGALDAGLMNARFTVTQGPYDLTPTLHAYFDPTAGVTRAAYSVAVSRYATQY